MTANFIIAHKMFPSDWDNALEVSEHKKSPSTLYVEGANLATVKCTATCSIGRMSWGCHMCLTFAKAVLALAIRDVFLTPLPLAYDPEEIKATDYK